MSKSFVLLPVYARLTAKFADLLLSHGVRVLADNATNVELGADLLLVGTDVQPLFEAELNDCTDWVLASDNQRDLAIARFGGERVITLDHGLAGVFATQEAVDCGVVPEAIAAIERSRLNTASALHTFVSVPHTTNRSTEQAAPMSAKNTIIDGDNAIAIVGVGAIMPGALTAELFWQNIKSGYDAIREVPQDRWDPALYWDADRSAPDKTYSKIGGFLEGFNFDRKAFRMPPSVVSKTDPTQLVCLEAVKQAFEDSGYDDKDFDRSRCAVVLGNALGGDLRDDTNLRIRYAEIHQMLRKSLVEVSLGQLSDAQLEKTLESVAAQVKSQYEPISEDSMPGELSNVIAGRVAGAFDLRGPNFTVDAACASSLAAIETAVQGLRAGQYDMAVTGGVDRSMGAPTFVKFSKIGALSPDGSRPFDKDANGFVMGEGAGILILKRLSDAIRDQDNIYALIRGVGSSSDGRGKGITAPNPKGQILSVQRAYKNAGYNPKSVSLFEAHGTSTQVGDPTEMESLHSALALDDSPWTTQHVGLGSVKSMIGHLKSAAAAASLIKTSFALKHAVLPPSINMKELNPAMKLEGTPIAVQTELADWTMPGDAPRRAGISAFGFGGTNFHVTLEEYIPSGGAPKFFSSEVTRATTSNAPVAMTAPKMSSGVVTFAGPDLGDLERQVSAFSDSINTSATASTHAHLRFLVGDHPKGALKLALSYADLAELKERVPKALRALQKGKGWRVLANQGIFFGDGSTAQGKLAMLFPGQGSQYLQMASELAALFPVVADTFAEADRVMFPILGKRLSDIISPSPDTDQSDAFLALSQTEVTQPAVLTVDIAIYRLLQTLGLNPDMVAGHSLGEYGACVAAGVMSFEDALTTVAARGNEMAKATPMNGDPGLMCGIAADAESVERILAQVDGYVVCANKNCPTQTIIAGSTEPVKEAIKAFKAHDIDTMLLPVSHAFHSKVVAAASEPLRRHLGSIDIHAPQLPILTNVTGGFYPTTPDEVRDLLAEQVAAPVEYIKLVETMYSRGVRKFVEVGPKRAQTAFVSSILADRDHIATFTNHPKRGDLGSIFDALGLLWANSAWSESEAVTSAPVLTSLTPVTQEPSGSSALSRPNVLAKIITTLCEKTGYDADEIETDFELEADLGIDTVKQAEIMASVREIYALTKDDDFRLAEYPTLDRLADYVMERGTGAALEPQIAAAQPPASTGLDRSEVLAKMVEVLCDKTGYDPEEIETDFELEADLGIDTVKQAEIMASVREIYALTKDDSFRLAEYPTLDRLADYVMERGQGAPAQSISPTQAPVIAAAVAPVAGVASGLDRTEVLTKMVEILCEKTGYDADEIETDFELEADLGIDTVKQAEIMASVREIYALTKDDTFRLAEYPTLDRLADYVLERGSGTLAAEPQVEAPSQALTESAPLEVELQTGPALDRAQVLAKMVEVLCEKTGYDADEIETDFELEADLGIDTVKQAEIMATVREIYALTKDESFRLAEYPTLDRLADYVLENTSDSSPVFVDAPVFAAPLLARGEDNVEETQKEDRTRAHQSAENAPHVVISGVSVGLPGMDDMFAEDALDRLLMGENLIGQLDADTRQDIVDKHITRLVKHEGGGGDMVEVTDPEEVIRLAGRPGGFEFGEFGVPDRMADGLDFTSKLAFAAGILALRDAGLPLVPRYRTTTKGKKVTIGWQLPQAEADVTGVILASAFAGQDALISEVTRAGSDPDYQFDHRLLLKMLGIANSRFAEFVGARGPNTKINNACASTTTAIAMAEDWIRLGRCKRVIILGADNASGEELMEWIGAGFLATGAASTEKRVEDAALPFDKRRDGMIIGMGAVGLIVEAAGLPEARGMEPIAEVLATRFVNSALHPTRLDVDHIANEVGTLVSAVEDRYGITREESAAETVFVSHETYTPARGGSAAAEIESIRRTYGEAADKIVIANTKGFTGHAMGAGIEDVVAVKALQRQRLPHIANFQEADPDLGNLNLSQGGKYELKYALRLAAGFGSQLAVAMLRFRTTNEDRVVNAAAYQTWLKDVSGFAIPLLEVDGRTLRLRDQKPKTTQTAPVEREQQQMRATTSGDFSPRMVVASAEHSPRVKRSSLESVLEGRSVIIAGGPLVVVNIFRRVLERSGATVIALSDRHDPMDPTADHYDFGDEEVLSDVIGTKIDGVVNLLGFSGEANTPADIHAAALHSFHLARALHGRLSETGFFLSITGMGGRLGLDRAAGPVLVGGAVCGFTKALAREWDKRVVRIVDLQRENLTEKPIIQALSELMYDHGVESGVVGGVRYAAHLLDASDSKVVGESRLPNSDNVVLVTGGAKGITAEVVKDLASRTGSKFALVGRTRLERDDLEHVDFKEEERRVRELIKATGKRVTPMAVKRGLSALHSQIAIAKTLAEVKALGAKEVRYYDCDLSDLDAVKAMVSTVRADLGPIAGVIHGAGVEISRLIHEKDDAEFNKVFVGKALGGVALWNAVEQDNPLFFVNFSSIAGRFGNLGQVDYSAANEVLNKLTVKINATSSTRSVSFDWTAWDEVGMATHGSMKTILESRGVELLPPSIGAPMVGDALADGAMGEFVVAGDLGEFVPDEPSPEVAEAALPFVHAVVAKTDTAVTLERTFDPEHDRFLRDHVYEGNPIVPGVIGLEFMARAAALLGANTAKVSQVKFLKAAKIHRGTPLIMRAHAKLLDGVVVAEVTSERTSKTGRKLIETHYSARFSAHEIARIAPFEAQIVRKGPKHDEIYEKYFHTGTFEVMQDLPFLGQDFVIGRGQVPDRRICMDVETPDMLSLPMVREMAFQTAGLWGMVNEDMSYLPLEIGASNQLGSILPGQAIILRSQQKRSAQEGTLKFDIEALNESGELLLQMEDVVLIGHRRLLEDEKFSPFDEIEALHFELTSKEATHLLSERRLQLENLNGVKEQAEYDRLRSPQRREEWVAARIALKEAVRMYLRDFRGKPVQLADIEIVKDEFRAPSASVNGRDLGLGVSATHSHGRGLVALALRPHLNLGIDLEAIEPRSPEFIRDYFSENELKLAPSLQTDHRVALLWSIKESVSKALRLGLNLSTSEIIVKDLNSDSSGVWRASVELNGKAQTTLDSLGGGALRVYATIGNGMVEVMATIEREDTQDVSSNSPETTEEVGMTPAEIAGVIALLSEKGLIPHEETLPGHIEHG